MHRPSLLFALPLAISADAGEWKSFNEKDNEKLETLYCDVTLEECSATGMQISFERYVIVIIH